MNYHIHHIVPRHMGGTDDPANLVKISHTCHTMWHWCDWQRTGSMKHQGSYHILRGLLCRELNINYDLLTDRAKRLPKKIIRFYGVFYVNKYLSKRRSRLRGLSTQYKIDHEICYNSPDLLASIYSGNPENTSSDTKGSSSR